MIPLAIDKLYFDGIEISKTDSDSGMSEIPSNNLGTIRKESARLDMRESKSETERQRDRESRWRGMERREDTSELISNFKSVPIATCYSLI